MSYFVQSSLRVFRIDPNETFVRWSRHCCCYIFSSHWSKSVVKVKTWKLSFVKNLKAVIWSRYIVDRFWAMCKGVPFPLCLFFKVPDYKWRFGRNEHLTSFVKENVLGNILYNMTLLLCIVSCTSHVMKQRKANCSDTSVMFRKRWARSQTQLDMVDTVERWEI